jgi:RNase P/RNase MRP subunit p30
LCDLIFIKPKDKPRQIVETKKNLIIFGLEEDDKKDFMHQRRSGFNHIMCKLAVKNKIKVGFSFRSLLNADISKRNVLIGRISSNIRLCKKYKVEMIIGSFAKDPYEMRNYNDLKSLFLEWGY